MLIQRFYAPADEVADVGLQEIDMPRLGRFVALAGKNGAGKSRLLNKLEWYVGARNSGLPHYQQCLTEVQNLQSAINQNPDNPNAGQKGS